MKPFLMMALATALLASAAAALAADKASQKFIEKAIQGNLAEIQMGQLAQQNGQGDDVKAYGKMLVDDHSSANEIAKKVAEQIGVTPPTEPSAQQKAMYSKMSKLSGAAFDRAFAMDMVADHKHDIAEFKKEARKKDDPAADFASQTLPTLEKHLDAAKKLTQNGNSPH
jgi:putative membrane protein